MSRSTARKLFGVAAGSPASALIIGMEALGGLGGSSCAQLAIVAATVCYAAPPSSAAIQGLIRWCRRPAR